MAVTKLVSVPCYEGRRYILGFEKDDFKHMDLREIILQNYRYIYVIIFKIFIFYSIVRLHK
jgi:hypothetical protein